MTPEENAIDRAISALQYLQVAFGLQDSADDAPDWNHGGF
jgi:hypothetical protein